MKITICSSIKFWNELLKLKADLEKLGHEVLIPPHEVKDGEGNKMTVSQYYELRQTRNDDWIWNLKKELILEHFGKINQADAILVLNLDKNEIKNYIGGNTLMEMGVALMLGKKIYLLNPIPEGLSYAEEIKGMLPTIINGDLSLLS